MLQFVFVSNLTTAPPVVYTLSISVLKRTSSKNMLKNPYDIDKWMTRRIRRLCAYTRRLLSDCQRGEAKSKKYILYMNVSYFGKDHRISAPSTVHPSVLSVFSLIVKNQI